MSRSILRHLIERILFSTWITRPTSTQESARRAYATKIILSIMTLSMFLSTPLLALARLIAPEEITPDMPLAALILGLLSVGGWWLAGRNSWRIASYVPPTIMFLLATVGTYTYGLGATNIMEYTVALILTVLLHDEKVWWFTFTLIIGTSLGLEWRMVRQHPEIGLDSLLYWLLVLTAFLTVVILLLRFLVSQFQHALTRLQALTLELQEEIVERKQVEEALRKSEEAYRTLFEGIPVGLYRVTPEGDILAANPALVEMLGYPDQATLLSTTSPDLFVNPEIRQQEIKQLIEADTVHGFETQLRCYNGSMIWVRDTARSVKDSEGHIRYVDGSLEDITTYKAMQEQIRRQQRLAAVGQLSAGIAHDFRNLLTTIILYAQLGLNKTSPSGNVRQSLQIIIDESHRATDLVQQLLDFSSTAMLERRPLELVTFVNDVLDVWQRIIPENIHIQLEVEETTSGPALKVMADPNRIEQALTNLALNARDAMPHGGELKISLSSINVAPHETPPVAEMAPGTWISLAVSDTGMGMDREVRDHLFEPFFTTKEVGQGTGLGLAQVFGIVRQHEGHVDVLTEVGKGSTFYLFLPLYQGEEEEVKTAEKEDMPPHGEGETILLVEDRPELRAAVKGILESLDYDVLTAANGREALTIYAEEGQDVELIVTDLIMPDMGGEALLMRIRQIAPQIRVIGITGYAVEGQAESLKTAGFFDVLTKPFAVERIASVVRQALDDG